MKPKRKRDEAWSTDGGARASHRRLRKAVLGQRLRLDHSTDALLDLSSARPGDFSIQLDRVAGLLNVCQEMLNQVRAELRAQREAVKGRAEAGQGLKILYVDDTARHVRIVQQIVNALGHDLIGAVSAAEGQRLAHEYASILDVAVIDLDLPGDDGLALVRQLHTDLVGLPIFALSSRCDEGQKQAALDAGCTEFLCKDVPLAQTLPELLLRLQGQMH